MRQEWLRVLRHVGGADFACCEMVEKRPGSTNASAVAVARPDPVGGSIDSAEGEEGPDPGALLSRGLGVAGSYLLRLEKLQGALDRDEAGALAKLLSSLNVIRRDDVKGGAAALDGATPEDVARQMADALGPDVLLSALVELIGEQDLIALVKTVARRVRAGKSPP